MDVNSFIVGYTKGKQSASGGGGGGSSGGAELNIAYGDTPPEDTTKLWVKTSEPSGEQVIPPSFIDSDKLETLSTTLPNATETMATNIVGTKIYLFGGYHRKTSSYTDSDKYLDTIRVFDTESESISTLSVKLPSAATGIGSAVVGTKIYLFGGYSGSANLDTIRVFDTESESISTLSVKLPSAMSSIACATIGTKIYLLSGSTSKTIRVFDTTNNTIETLSIELPHPVNLRSVAAVGNNIYCFGGASNNYYADIFVFDTANNSIITLDTALPRKITSMVALRVGDKIYWFGLSNTTTYFTEIYVFDPKTESVSELDVKFPDNTSSMGAAAVGNKVYLFGGEKKNESNYRESSNTIHLFTAKQNFGFVENHLYITANTVTNIFNLTATVTIGVDGVYKGNEVGELEKVEAALYKDGEWVTI